MVRYSILSVAAVAFGILGAEAGPCRPTTVTSLAETSSTVAPETSLTNLATTVTTSVPETTSTTVAETTTSSEAPACVETQVVVNPGFDLSDNDKTPWTGDGVLINDGAYSAPNALSVIFENGQGSARIVQTLHNLEGNYRLSYRYGAFSAVNLGAGFGCSITPKVADTALPAADAYELSGWNLESHTWSSGSEAVVQADLVLDFVCGGEYDQLTINVDDFTLTRVCGPEAS